MNDRLQSNCHIAYLSDSGTKEPVPGTVPP